MTIKSILLSNDNGTILESPTGSFGYDDSINYLNISDLSASQINLSGASNALLLSNNGAISAIPAAGNSGKFIVSNGTSLVVSAVSNMANGTASGDLSGSYPNSTVKSLSNVVSGTLPVQYGGLGSVLTSLTSGSLIVANGAGSVTAVSTATATSSTTDYVLGVTNGSWSAMPATAAQRDIGVQYFTCSAANTTTTYTWTKSNPNHIWARVILQGGGGAGAGSGTTLNAANGAGGGAGGFSDFTVFVGGVNSATVVVGAGGVGANTATTGQSGSSTYFSGSGGLYLRAAGGLGGAFGGAGGAGGAGFTYYGGAGGTATSNQSTSTAGLDSAGASGGGAGGWTNTATAASGKRAGIASSFLNPLTPIVASSGSYSENLFGYTVPVGIGTGGSGGTSDNFGYNGVFGGGGGGAGGLRSPGAVSGGSGGDGFAIIVSY